MAKTITYTGTKTFTRVELLKLQVHIALRKTTNITDEILARTVDKGIDKQLLSKITVYGVDDQNICRAQLILEIDWDEHNRQIMHGKATVTIDSRWTDDTAIELDETIKIFNSYVESNSLKVKWQYSHPQEVDLAVVCRELGVVKAETIKLKPIWEKKIPELPELCVGLFLPDD